MKPSIVAEHASDIIAIVLAGGRGSRLHDLTDHHAKPALTVGPNHRLIDFTLANVRNSAISQVLTLTQYASASLHDHLRATWMSDSDMSVGIEEGVTYGGFNGTADAVAKIVRRIDAFHPREVVIVAGDHLYQMDYRPFVAQHRRSGADVTVGAVHVPLQSAHEFGIMSLDDSGRIGAFQEKPKIPAASNDMPDQALASMGIYVFTWDRLRELLIRMSSENPELDFGKHVIPHLVEQGRAFGYALPGRTGLTPFWEDLGTLDAYHRINLRLAAGQLPLDPEWSIAGRRDPARSSVARRAGITCSSIAEDAYVGPRTRLTNVVVQPGAWIGSDVTLSDAIVTSDAIIPDRFDLAHAVASGALKSTVSDHGIRVLSARAMVDFAAAETARGRCALQRMNDNARPELWTAQTSRPLASAARG